MILFYVTEATVKKRPRYFFLLFQATVVPQYVNYVLLIKDFILWNLEEKGILFSVAFLRSTKEVFLIPENDSIVESDEICTPCFDLRCWDVKEKHVFF